MIEAALHKTNKRSYILFKEIIHRLLKSEACSKFQISTTMLLFGK